MGWLVVTILTRRLNTIIKTLFKRGVERLHLKMGTCLPSEDKDSEHSQTSLTHLERVGEERG